MMFGQSLKQFTAFTERIGPILDPSGVEYASAVIGDLSITKNGTTAAMAAAATLTYDVNGYYSLVATTGNTDTLGRLAITCNKAGYQMPPLRYEVLTAQTFDALVTNAWNAANGGGDVQRINGVSASSVVAIAANIGSSSAFTGTSLSGSVGSVTGSVGSVTGSVGSISGITFPTNFSSFSIDGSGRVYLQATQTGVTIPTVTNTGTVTGNVNGSVASVTGNVGGNVVGNVNGNVTGSTGSVVGAVGSVTGSVGSVAGSIAGDVSGKVLGGGASSITGDGVRASSVSGSVASVAGSVGSVTGSVGSVAGNVSGDVAGKVLGGGSSAISGAGVRADTVTGSVGSVVGSVGSVTGSVGSISGVTFPSNFSSLLVSAGGIVSANATQFGGVSTTGILTSTGVFATAALANAPSGSLTADAIAAKILKTPANLLATNSDGSVNAASSGGGTGSYNVTITVNDGTTPLQNATVTLTINSSRYYAVTNASGVAVLTPNEGNGTYGVQLTCGGYQFTTTTLAVSGNTSHIYSMTQNSITPPTNGTAIAYAYTYDATGTVIITGVPFLYQMLELPSGSTGVIPSSAPLTATSDSNGRLLLSNLFPNANFTLTNTQTGASLPFSTGAANTTTAINGGIL